MTIQCRYYTVYAWCKSTLSIVGSKETVVAYSGLDPISKKLDQKSKVGRCILLRLLTKTMPSEESCFASYKLWLRGSTTQIFKKMWVVENYGPIDHGHNQAPLAEIREALNQRKNPGTDQTFRVFKMRLDAFMKDLQGKTFSAMLQCHCSLNDCWVAKTSVCSYRSY